MRFSSEKRAEVKQELGGELNRRFNLIAIAFDMMAIIARNGDVGSVGSKLGAMWHELSQEEQLVGQITGCLAHL